MTADVGVVIVAAGSGTRTGSAELKQFRWINGKPMLLHSVQAFQARDDVTAVVAVLPRSHAGDPPPWIFQSDLSRLLISVGGASRTDSVRNGLDDLADEVRIVLVHDAARPNVPMHVVDAVIAAAREGTGAVPAMPVNDTVKRVDANGYVIESPPRAELRAVQTPQAFPRDMIVDAYRRASREGVRASDDAAICEWAGYPVRVVAGDERLAKVTTESDFARVESLWAETAS